jgi:hypothetical protein
VSKTYKDKKYKYLTSLEQSKHLRTKCVETNCEYCYAIPKTNRSKREREALAYELSAYNLLTATDALQETLDVFGVEKINPLTTTTKEAN